MGNVIDITAGSFEREVLGSEGVVVVEFWAPRCAHCERFEQTYERLPDIFGGGVRFLRVNVLESDEDKGLAMRAGVQAVPTLKVFYRGVIVGDLMGDWPLEEAVERLKEIIDNKERCIAKSTPIRGR